MRDKKSCLKGENKPKKMLAIEAHVFCQPQFKEFISDCKKLKIQSKLLENVALIRKQVLFFK